MAEKGKVPQLLQLALRYDDRLLAVTNAFDNLKRISDGAALATGAFKAFPLPGLRLKDDTVDLPLPLTGNHSWGVRREYVKIRNPYWKDFVDKAVSSVRVPLGITDAAQLDARLEELVLVETGGELPVHDGIKAAAQKQGRFGSFVVVLPGQFSGGDVAIQLGSSRRQQPQRWSPSRTDRDTYEIGYAAFYNDVNCVESATIESGEALCLVYELVTTTIHELPRYAGKILLEEQVQTALTNCFTVPPLPYKRVKISDDAWQTINEFTTDHRFVYPIMGEKFKKLQGDEKRLCQRLATFCARSGGRYALYLVRLGGCSWESSRDKDQETIYKFTLLGPWLEHGHTQELPFATTFVNHRLELGPAGFMERVKHRSEHGRRQPERGEDMYCPFHIYHYTSGSNVCTLRQHYALVVQPATLENKLWGSMPPQELIVRLKELVPRSPLKASQITRQFLSKKQKWTNTDEKFAPFLEVVVALDDAALFCDWLRSVVTFEYDEASIPRAIDHFGWHAPVGWTPHARPCR